MSFAWGEERKERGERRKERGERRKGRVIQERGEKGGASGPPYERHFWLKAGLIVPSHVSLIFMP